MKIIGMVMKYILIESSNVSMTASKKLMDALFVIKVLK